MLSELISPLLATLAISAAPTAITTQAPSGPPEIRAKNAVFGDSFAPVGERAAVSQRPERTAILIDGIEYVRHGYQPVPGAPRKSSSVWSSQRLEPNHDLTPVGSGALIQAAQRNVPAFPSKERAGGNASISGDLLHGLALLVTDGANQRGELAGGSGLVNGVGLAGHRNSLRLVALMILGGDPSGVCQLGCGLKDYSRRFGVNVLCDGVSQFGRRIASEVAETVLTRATTETPDATLGSVDGSRLVSENEDLHCCLLAFDNHASILQLIGNNASGILQNSWNIFQPVDKRASSVWPSQRSAKDKAPVSEGLERESSYRRPVSKLASDDCAGRSDVVGVFHVSSLLFSEERFEGESIGRLLARPKDTAQAEVESSKLAASASPRLRVATPNGDCDLEASTHQLFPMQGEQCGILHREVWSHFYRVHPEYATDVDMTTFRNIGGEWKLEYWTLDKYTKPVERFVRPDDTECTETEYGWGMTIWRGEKRRSLWEGK